MRVRTLIGIAVTCVTVAAGLLATGVLVTAWVRSYAGYDFAEFHWGGYHTVQAVAHRGRVLFRYERFDPAGPAVWSERWWVGDIRLPSTSEIPAGPRNSPPWRGGSALGVWWESVMASGTYGCNIDLALLPLTLLALAATSIALWFGVGRRWSTLGARVRRLDSHRGFEIDGTRARRSGPAVA